MVNPDKYPGTSVLENLLNLKDFKKYDAAIATVSVVRLHEIQEGKAEASRIDTFDDKHLKAIHKHLFQDIFTWAGKTRSYNMGIGLGDVFTEAQKLDADLKIVTDEIQADNFLMGLDRATFIEKAAKHLGNLGVIHPFPEGNGRAIRTFLWQLGKQAGYALDWRNVPQWQTIVSNQRYHRERAVEPLQILIDTALR